MDEPIRVLLLEDEPVDQIAFQRFVQRERLRYTTLIASSLADARAALARDAFDVVLADYNLGADTSLDLLPELDGTPCIVITGLGDEEIAVRAMKLGAADYLTKDPDGRYLTMLPAVVLGAISRKHAERELVAYRAQLEQMVAERTEALRRANARLLEEIAERQLAERQLQKQLARLEGLRAIDMAITASTDLHLTLNVLIDQVVAHLAVDAVGVLVLNPRTHVLEYVAGRGLGGAARRRARLRLGEDVTGEAALDRELVSLPDIRAEGARLVGAAELSEAGLVSYYAMPLIAKGQVNGVLELLLRADVEPDGDWLNFYRALAGQAAIAIDNSQLVAGLQRSNYELTLAYDATIEGWSRAMDLRDRETEGHTQRVTEMTVRLAEAMGVPEERMEHVRRGALLHDIGKLGVPDSILLKPGPLTDEEWAVMRRHPQYAYEMLSQIAYLRQALDIPYCHHERYDGSGYPRGLRGQQIPLEARLFAVVDAWDALRSDRPYRAGWPRERVIAYLLEQSGTHFDPRCVELFLRMGPEW